MNLSLTGWAFVGTLLLAVLLGTGLTVQTERLKAKTAEYAQFQAGVKALGDIAIQRKKEQEAADKTRKEKADASNKTAIAKLVADNQRLRNARPGGGFVPSPGPNAPSPDVATFDRAKLESAIRSLDSGVQGLIEAGDEARVNLDTAKGWAKP